MLVAYEIWTEIGEAECERVHSHRGSEVARESDGYCGGAVGVSRGDDVRAMNASGGELPECAINVLKRIRCGPPDLFWIGANGSKSLFAVKLCGVSWRVRHGS